MIPKNLNLNDSIFRVTIDDIQIIEIHGIRKDQQLIYVKNSRGSEYKFYPDNTKCIDKGHSIYSDFSVAQDAQLEIRKRKIKEAQDIYLKSLKDYEVLAKQYSNLEPSNPFK